MNKTIAIVINTSWNIFNFRLGLLKALQEEGYRVIAIAPTDEYSQKLEELGIEYYDININNKGTNPLEDAKLIFAFYKLYKELSPDIILQYTIKPNIYGSIAAGILGIPVISNISGLGTVFLNSHLSSKIARLLYRGALKVPEKVFYQNEHDRKLFIATKLVDAEKTGLLPGSGVDTDKYSATKWRLTDGTNLHFLLITRLLKDKGLVEYVEAAEILKKKYPNVVFAILGAYYPGNPSAVTKEKMQEWEAKGYIKYLGISDDVKTIIDDYDCVVLPSYREGLSRVLLESASMGKPIVVTDVPGCAEVVDDGVNGYLCQVKDVDSLREAIEKMIALSDDQRKEMGRKGREKVINEFDEKLVIEKYINTISQLLK